MKAIIIENKNALVLDILNYENETKTELINLQLTVNPVIRISVDSSKTFIVDTDDLENQKDIALTLAESLVGENGRVILYQPKTKKNEKKITKKLIKK